MSVVDLGSIIGYASSIEIGQKTSIAQVSSQSGRRVAQRRGPVLYTMIIGGSTYRANSEKLRVLEMLVLGMNYGANTIRFTLKNADVNGDSPTKLYGGTWVGQPVVKGSGAAGKSISISGCTPNVSSYYSTLDYVQFEGSNKVYQLSAEIATTNAADSWGTGTSTTNSFSLGGDTDSNGECTLTLNSPLVVSPLDGSKVTVGQDVQFLMSMSEMPTFTHLPGGVVEVNDMKFIEVIEET